MAEGWQERQWAAERMEKLASNRHISHSEREQIKRDAERIRREAAEARRRYVNWLWGYS